MAFKKSKFLIFALVILALASLAFSPLIAHAASTTPTQDSVGTVQQKSSVSSVSWSHTVGNFSNRLLVVGISVNGSKTVSSVTYGSQNLIRLDKISYGSNTLDDEVWYAVNPTVGTGTIKVTLSGSANVVADSVSFYNVNQQTPFGVDAKASGKGLTATINVPSGSNQVVLDVLASDTMLGNFQPASGQTSLWNGFSNTPQSGASIKQSSGTSTPMTWADSQSDNWAEIGVALLPVATTPTPTIAPTAIPTAIPTSLPTATPTPVPTYNITGTVFVDANKNGVQDTGENGSAGVTVSLNTGPTTTTDSNGNYTFSNLAAGTYTETLTVPTGYMATTTNPATVALAANTTENFGIAPAPLPTATPTPTNTPTAGFTPYHSSLSSVPLP